MAFHCMSDTASCESPVLPQHTATEYNRYTCYQFLRKVSIYNCEYWLWKSKLDLTLTSKLHIFRTFASPSQALPPYCGLKIKSGWYMYSQHKPFMIPRTSSLYYILILNNAHFTNTFSSNKVLFFVKAMIWTLFNFPLFYLMVLTVVYCTASPW